MITRADSDINGKSVNTSIGVIISINKVPHALVISVGQKLGEYKTRSNYREVKSGLSSPLHTQMEKIAEKYNI